jgi:MFS family permease
MSFTSASAVSQSRWRDVRISAVARGASIGGDMLTATALLLVLQERGLGGWAVAAVLIAASAPLVLFSPLTGRLADRVDSRLLITTVPLGQAAACVAMAYTRSPAVLIGLVALVATGAAITSPTLAALLPEMVRGDDLPRAAAMGQTATVIGMMAGPPLAGLLVGEYGLRAPLLLDGLTFLGISAAGLLIGTRRRPAPAAPAGTPEPGGPAPDWSLWRDGLLMPMVVMVALVIAVTSGANVVDVFFVRGTLHASTTMYGVIGGVWTGAMIIGSRLVARTRLDDPGYGLLMAGALASCCAVIGACGLMPQVGWLIPLFVLGGAANGAMNSISAVLLSRRAPSAIRGRTFGYFGAVASGASMTGFVLGGVLVERFAPGALLVASGALGLLVVAACALPMLRAARRERARAASAADAEADAGVVAEADAGVVAEADAAVVAEAGAPVPAVASAT